MSTTSNQAIESPESIGKKFRHLAVEALFAVVLLIPKLLHLRRNRRPCMLFRSLLAVGGAALVILPLGAWSSFFPAVIGLAMFVSAIFLHAVKSPESQVDKARELGALVVVNGGRFKLGEASSFAARLYVGSDHVRVLDSHLKSFLEIPVSEITSANAEESHGHWFLRINWARKTAAFSYRGVFAEHLARVAESTIQSVMRPALPVLPQRRAAGA
jgi:hypothetical protein